MWLVSVIVMPLLPVMPDMCLSVVEREGPTCRQKVASLCQLHYFLVDHWQAYPRVRCLRGVVPKFIPVKFLGAKVFTEYISIPKKVHNLQAHMVHKEYPQSILGPCRQTSLGKVSVAKVLSIPLQVSNKLRSEKLHTFLWLQPQGRWICFHGTTPWTLKIPKLGLNKFPRGMIFSGIG